MQLRILYKECCGNGQCREIAPGAFGMDSKNKAIILDPESETPEKLLEAAEACTQHYHTRTHRCLEYHLNSFLAREHR